MFHELERCITYNVSILGLWDVMEREESIYLLAGTRHFVTFPITPVKSLSDGEFPSMLVSESKVSWEGQSGALLWQDVAEKGALFVHPPCCSLSPPPALGWAAGRSRRATGKRQGLQSHDWRSQH